MAPTSTAIQASSASSSTHLSPAELAYLHTSLSLPRSSHGPIRPDGRSATQFRPLTAETDILPGANGSARVGFADGSEAVVGVKAEIVKTDVKQEEVLGRDRDEEGEGEEGEDGVAGGQRGATGSGWVEMSIEIPGFRDDDALPVFLAEMMREAVLAGGEGLMGRLRVNRRWHWKIYVDILLLSPPLSYPLPLLSLATHLALLSTRLPRIKSEGDEDPLFDDDWDATEYLYPRSSEVKRTKRWFRPPITLLVISVGDNIIFDPSREEIAVAEAVLAVSVGRNEAENENGDLKLLSIRTVDPPSRMTHPGIPNSENAATANIVDSGAGAAGASGAAAASAGGGSGASAVESKSATVGEEDEVPGVWRPRRGGVKRSVITRMVKMVLERGGVGEEVLEGLEGVKIG